MDGFPKVPEGLGELMWRAAISLLAEQEEAELTYELAGRKDGCDARGRATKITPEPEYGSAAEPDKSGQIV